MYQRPFSYMSNQQQQQPVTIIDRSVGSSSKTANSNMTQPECASCTNKFSISPLVIHPCTECTKRTVCDSCLVDYLDVRINNNNFRQIQCADDNCQAVLDSTRIFEYLKQLGGQRELQLVQRYDRFLLNAFVSSQDGFIWCQHNCGNGQIHYEKENAPIVTCNTCHRKSCFVHKTIWHEGMTCAEFDSDRNGDAKSKQHFLENANRVYRSCPGCGVVIEKNGGCDHMNCTQCGRRYNWSESSYKQKL